MAESIDTTSTDARQPLEVVEQAPSAQVPAVVTERNAAIEAAAEAALMPGVPGRDEFLTLAMTAKMLSLSGAAPEAVRNNPYVAFHVAMLGRDLGISPSAALNLIDVIPGKNGTYQLSLSPELMNGQISRLRLGKIWKKKVTLTECVATAVGPGGIDRRCRLTWRDDVHASDCDCDILGETEFTWEDAKIANLVGDQCTPGAHDPACMNNQSAARLKCNQGYRTYPKRMLWWRAAGFCADDYFPEAGLGLYSPEELGAVVDAEGRPIDPSTVELPDGYQQALPPPNPNNEDATDEDKWNLKLRIMALPEDIGAELRETWKKSDKLTAVDKLTQAGMKTAQSVLAGAESKARTKHKDWSSVAAIEAIAAKFAAAVLPVWAGTSDSAPTPPDSGPGPTETASADDSTPAPETGGKTAPVVPSSEPDGARGHAAPEPTDEDLEGASPKLINDTIAEVLAMKAHDVDKALTGYRLHTEGELDTRKRRLTLAIVRDRKNQPQA